MNPFFARHRRFRERLSPFIDGGLPPQQARALQDHLLTCAGCRHELEELRAVALSLRSLPQADAPRSFALTPELASRPPRAARPKRLPLLQGGMRLATAGLTVALAAVIAVDLNQGGGEDRTVLRAQSAAPAHDNAGGPGGATGGVPQSLEDSTALGIAFPTPSPADTGLGSFAGVGGPSDQTAGGDVVPAPSPAEESRTWDSVPPEATPTPEPALGLAEATPAPLPADALSPAESPSGGGNAVTGVGTSDGEVATAPPPAPAETAVPGPSVDAMRSAYSADELEKAAANESAEARTGGGTDTLLMVEIVLAAVLAAAVAGTAALAIAGRRR